MHYEVLVSISMNSEVRTQSLKTEGIAVGLHLLKASELLQYATLCITSKKVEQKGPLAKMTSQVEIQK